MSENNEDLGYDDIRLQFTTEHGKDFISRVLGLCGIFEYIVGEDKERQLGKRDVGLELVDMIMEVDPELYPNLLLRQAKLEAVGAKDDD